MENHQTRVKKKMPQARFCLPHRGWEWGWGIYYLYISFLYLSYVCIWFCAFVRPFLDPLWQTYFFFFGGGKPSFNILEMAHTNFFPSIRKQHISIQFELQIIETRTQYFKHIFNTSKNRNRTFQNVCFRIIISYMFM